MCTEIRREVLVPAWLWLTICCSGCATLGTEGLGLDAYEIPQGQFAAAPGSPEHVSPTAPPAELAKVSLPDYVIEPPDILLIESIRAVPKTPYELQPQDVVQIVVLGTTPDRPIAGQFLVEPAGTVNLGPGYGTVKISGLTTDEAAEAIRVQLLRELNAPEVAVSLFQSAGQLIVTGEHLVAPDGTVNLGTYGRVYVAGMSLDEARARITQRLEQYFENPTISLDVFVFNSKFFYIINQGNGQVVKFPVTGNETVLDAVSLIGGIDPTNPAKMWISRPAPAGTGCAQILPVDWKAITRDAVTSTNYQLLPGDRLFIAEDRLQSVFALASRILNPIERVIGFSLLGAQTVQTLQRFPEGFRQF